MKELTRCVDQLMEFDGLELVFYGVDRAALHKHAREAPEPQCCSGSVYLLLQEAIVP